MPLCYDSKSVGKGGKGIEDDWKGWKEDEKEMGVLRIGSKEVLNLDSILNTISFLSLIIF